MDRTPTLLLTERVAAECRLAPDDVDFLLAEHRAHVDLVPAGRRGHYRLTPAGHVGTIVAPSCRLVIRPKVPLRSLFHLLDPDADVPTVSDRTSAVPGAEALDFLAGRLARLLAERAAAGLHRGYAERAEPARFLQGSLDLPAHLREQGGRKDRLHCRYDDFSADVPCNQVPKATAELLLRSPLLGDGVRAALRRGLEAFAAVSPVELGPDAFLAADDRPAEAYRPLLDLCRLLAESLAPGPAAGSVRGPAFLLDLERVFERFLTSSLARLLHGRRGKRGEYAVDVQPFFRANEPAAGQPDVHVRPDLLLRRDGDPLVVLDAKWKRLSRSALVTDDVYQVLAYCAALGVRRAVLVYPGRRERAWPYRLERAPVRLTVHALPVAGSRESLRRSVQRLARSLRVR